jgi:hypothetical protein
MLEQHNNDKQNGADEIIEDPVEGIQFEELLTEIGQ